MKSFEELDYRQTPLGELILRRRLSPSVPGVPVYEVKLADQLLMSSSVCEGERALARLALDELSGGPWDVLVGGLGLGYTALAALEFAQVRRLTVVEYLEAVIEWHRRRLLPASPQLLDDPRCSLVEGDFFARVAPGGGGERHDAILLDIDHSPESWLHPRHGEFYTAGGLGGIVEQLRPGGIFGLWSASAPTDRFLDLLRGLFPAVRAEEVRFLNPHLGRTDSNWIVLAGGG
jgi:spermidine synthase